MKRNAHTPWLLIAIVFLLPSCASGPVTRAHHDCAVDAFAWSKLKAAPGNADALMASANVGALPQGMTEHWFAKSDDQLELCRIDTRGKAAWCPRTDYWIFEKARDGTWKPGEPGILVCVAD